MTKLLAPALRIGGVLAGIGGALLVSGGTLAAGIAAAGLEGRLTPTMARVAAMVILALVGFIIGSRLAEMAERKFAAPAGRRQDAVETVPRLRRHLVEDDGQRAGMATTRYLDPDPAPTAPVAVSFAELGLEPSRAGDYPEPSAEGDADAFLFARIAGRPDSAGSASDEWDDCPAPLPRATPPQPPIAAGEARHDAAPEADRADQAGDVAAADRNPMAATPAPPLPDDPRTDDFAMVAEQIESLQARLGPVAAEPYAGEPHVGELADADRNAPRAFSPDIAAAPRGPRSAGVAEASAGVSATSPVGNDGYTRPSFARPDAAPDASWYDGAADDEDEAEDDGAGYGSLIAIGLGKNHAPRGAAGQRGEAGLPVRGDEAGRAVVPHGKPQDFRLREALTELARLA